MKEEITEFIEKAERSIKVAVKMTIDSAIAFVKITKIYLESFK